eukprot:TRINITY_DN44414_c0_g1_i1.p1 TRINITY_DN44414_c0_g1~~TRINITY_DN44414_c0_g1_i1.p1  ORF type:complete len:256 (-),score=30.07 TRINITY_DN44414_c0_g1_i1:383-1150(-)
MGSSFSSETLAPEDENPFLEDSAPKMAIKSVESGKDLRMLCLHGRGSCNKVTQLQVQFIGLRKNVQCHFLEGPLLADAYSADFQEAFGGNFYQWHSTTNWSGVERGLRRVLHYAETHGPYDGIFGFSQGAGIATLLSRSGVLKALGIADGRPPWRFVMCACGADTVGVPADLPSADSAGEDTPINLPSFHIIGTYDFARFHSSSLAAAYVETSVPKKVVHYVGVGHGLPMTLMKDAALQGAIVSFLKDVAALENV